jgi:O-antigen ligase
LDVSGDAIANFVAQQLLAILAAMIASMVMLVSIEGFGEAKSALVAVALPLLVAGFAMPDKERKMLFFIVVALPVLAIDLPPRRYGFALDDVLIYVLGITIGFRIVLRETPSLFGGRTIFTGPLVALAVGVVLSTLFSGDVGLAETDLIWSLKYVLFYLIVIKLVSSKSDLKTLILLIVAGFVPTVLLALAQIFLHVGLKLNPDVTQNTAFQSGSVNAVRAFGTFSESIVFAQYLLVPLSIVGALAIYSRNSFRTLMLSGAFGLGVIALIFSLSRGAWGSFLIASSIMLWLRLPRMVLPYLALWPMVAVGAIIGYWDSIVKVLPAEVVARAEAFGVDFQQGRSLGWSAAWNIFVDHPLFGVGLRNLFHILPLYEPEALGDIFWTSTVGKSGAESFGVGHVHVDNFYMTSLAELGLVGMLPLVWVLATALRQSYANFRDAPPDLKPYALGLFGGLVGMLLSAASAYGYSDHRLALLLWMMLAMIVVLQRLIAAERVTQPSPGTGSAAGGVPPATPAVSSEATRSS